MEIWKGNLRKMSTLDSPNEKGHVQYVWNMADVLDPQPSQELRNYVGHDVHIKFEGLIHCTQTGRVIKKTFGDGLSYNAWLESPQTVESVLRPELSRIHEGIALRDFEWEQSHHNQPHVVYLSKTGALKVGVTRSTNQPYRWHDQGAVGAIVVARTPYRQLAGQFEVALKDSFSDRTNYRKMLQLVQCEPSELEEAREQAFEALGLEFEHFFDFETPASIFHYPVIQYPEKVQSIRLDKMPDFKDRLVGIKGQYLIFESAGALNVRSHSGYSVSMKWS